MNRLHRILTSATLLTLLPLAAQAHPGHELHASFAAGLMHPLTGLDHLAVLLCLGVLAAGAGGAEGVGAHIGRVDVDLDRVIHLGVDKQAGKAGVAAAR
jgi:hydrogenase/urease accessory protein HupE